MRSLFAVMDILVMPGIRAISIAASPSACSESATERTISPDISIIPISTHIFTQSIYP